MDFDDFVNLVTTRKVTMAQQRRLRALWEISGSSIGCQVHEAARWEAQTLVRRYKAILTDVKGTEKRMAAIAGKFQEYECLLSIPGFGPIVSAMVLAAIGDPSRFTHRKQLLRLAGLDLSASRSGQTSDTAKPVISKQGKAALRYALVQAAMIASAKSSSIRGYFAKLIKGRELECGIMLKMKVKLAAKLLVVAWTLMKTKENFKASYFME